MTRVAGDFGSIGMAIDSVVDDVSGCVRFAVATESVPIQLDGFALTLYIGRTALLHVPKFRDVGCVIARVVSLADLRTLDGFQIDMRYDHWPGAQITSHLLLSGGFFDAISIYTPQLFFLKVQADAARYHSPILLEFAARAAHWRFDRDFTVSAAALTVIGHRFIDLLNLALCPDASSVSWFIAEAAQVVWRGEERIKAVDLPDWEDVRWTLSLATVAGYLSLTEGRPDRAQQFFSVRSRYSEQIAAGKAMPAAVADVALDEFPRNAFPLPRALVELPR